MGCSYKSSEIIAGSSPAVPFFTIPRSYYSHGLSSRRDTTKSHKNIFIFKCLFQFCHQLSTKTTIARPSMRRPSRWTVENALNIANFVFVFSNVFLPSHQDFMTDIRLSIKPAENATVRPLCMSSPILIPNYNVISGFD